MQQPGVKEGEDDPRQAKIFSGKVLQHRVSYAQERRIVLAHWNRANPDDSRACAIDHRLDSKCQHSYRTSHTEDFGQVVFTIAAQPQVPIHLNKYMVYYTSKTASPDEVCRRAEWTLDRVVGQGFTQLLAEQEQYMDEFWQRSDVRVSNIQAERTRLTTIELQQAIRVNLFHILQASARAEKQRRPRQGIDGPSL